MLSFEPEKLKARLAALSQQDRVTFAIACAVRAQSRREFPLDDATAALCSRAIGLAREGRVGEQLDSVLKSLLASTAIDEDDVAAVAYALECARDGTISPAFWCAQRCYDQADAIAQRDRPGPADATREQLWLRHPTVQGEFEAQREDLRRLGSRGT